MEVFPLNWSSRTEVRARKQARHEVFLRQQSQQAEHRARMHLLGEVLFTTLPIIRMLLSTLRWRLQHGQSTYLLEVDRSFLPRHNVQTKSGTL